MLDPKFIRENPEIVKRKSQEKNKDPKIVEEWLQVDTKFIELQKQVEKLNQTKNEIADMLKDASKRTEEVINKGKDVKNQIEEVEKQLNTVREQWQALIILIPNMHFDDTPVGKDESENKVVKQVGKPPQFAFTPKDHMQLGEELGIIDTQMASQISGSRFNYLKGQAAVLEMAIVNWVFRTLSDEKIIKQISKTISEDYPSTPFIPVVPPVMIKPEIYTKMARLDPTQAEERYYIPSDDIYLIGSAEHTLGPLHYNQTLNVDELPIRYIGFSTAFRREAGSYGKDVKGILRVHQFDKLEMESFTTPEMSRQEQDFIVAIQEYLLSELKLPYQVIQICTGDMGGPDARQIDLETWVPTQNKYRETHTSDLMTDYQSRRMNTKVKLKTGSTEYVHMNDATAFAIGRILIAIIENYQQSDGSIKIPEVLIPYTGFDVIAKKN
jgi:seryl-tRNA synthetase